MRVHLTPSVGGPGVDALLEIDCEIGKVPGGHLEGVRLVVDNGLNFNQKVSGFTVFVQESCTVGGLLPDDGPHPGTDETLVQVRT